MTKHEKMLRRTGITAAEAVAIAGFSTTMTATEVYRRKLRPVGRPLIDPWQPHILARYAKKTGMFIERQQLRRHEDLRFALCEPILTGYGAPGAGKKIVRCLRVSKSKLPEALRLEAVWEMGATGLRGFDFAVLAGKRLHIKAVEFDKDTFDRLYAAAEHFLVESCFVKRPPIEAK